MTGTIEQSSLDSLKKRVTELDGQLELMRPLLRQMHLLSSNAVSAAARAGSEGDAFRVLTQAIQQLGQEINTDLQQTRSLLNDCLSVQNLSAAKALIRQIDDALSGMPQAVKKGEYLAICSAVEAAHAESFADSFDSVAAMLKQLINNLRQQVSAQRAVLDRLKEFN